MSDEAKIKWMRKYMPYSSDQECLNAYETYQSYREEGQSQAVALQYAGITKENEGD